MKPRFIAAIAFGPSGGGGGGGGGTEGVESACGVYPKFLATLVLVTSKWLDATLIGAVELGLGGGVCSTVSDLTILATFE